MVNTLSKLGGKSVCAVESMCGGLLCPGPTMLTVLESWAACVHRDGVVESGVGWVEQPPSPAVGQMKDRSRTIAFLGLERLQVL